VLKRGKESETVKKEGNLEKREGRQKMRM